MKTTKIMTQKNLLVLLVSVFALAVFASSVSAFGTIERVEVNGLDVTSGSVDLGNFAGQTVPVLVVFRVNDTIDGGFAEDVRVKAWISGESENAAVTSRFDALQGRTYQEVLHLRLPSDLDDLEEGRRLEIIVENTDYGEADRKTIVLTVQRESYIIEILNVDIQPEVKAGEALLVDVVLKNRGRHEADDVFLKVRIPELGLETTTYFGDLAPVDHFGNYDDEEDSVERRTALRIPTDTPAGLYTVELEASNSDSFTRTERRILVVDAGSDTQIVSSSQSKTFNVGEQEEYKLTIVNRGTTVRVYELLLGSSSSKLNVELDESLVVVPAGTSRTVSILTDATEKGDYVFTVEVYSDSELVDTKTFSAEVEGGKARFVAGGRGTDATVLFTIVLAIIFIVLLVVLIVLLTRKPEKLEESGESYY